MAVTKKKPTKAKPVKTEDTGSVNARPDEEIQLPPQYQVFALEYVKDWNGTRAAIAAGYAHSSAAVHAYRLLRNDNIQAFIKRHVELVAMGADEVLLRLADVARGSLEPFICVTNGDIVTVDLSSEQVESKKHLLKKIKPKTRKGDDWTEQEIELEIHDPLRALELLGRHHKLFTDNVNHGGKVQTEDVTDDERFARRAARVAEILHAAGMRRDRRDSQ